MSDGGQIRGVDGVGADGASDGAGAGAGVSAGVARDSAGVNAVPGAYGSADEGAQRRISHTELLGVGSGRVLVNSVLRGTEATFTEHVKELHRSLAPSESAFNLVWTHCVIVSRIGFTLAQRYLTKHTAAGAVVAGPLPNPTVARLGGLVHDIGVYRVFDEAGVSFDGGRYIFHGLEGYRILLDTGYGEDLAEFARNHTGVGITADDVARQHLTLPAGDYSPRTIEQELVMYADKFHTKSQPPTFVSSASARRSAERFGEDNAARFDALTARYGVPVLAALADEYKMVVR